MLLQVYIHKIYIFIRSEKLLYVSMKKIKPYLFGNIKKK